METTVNKRFEELRKALNVSQSEFAKNLDMSAPAISRIESGATNPSMRTLKTIANVYGVSIKWLQDGSGEMFSDGGAIVSNRESINPWENALVKELKEEVTFLRELLKNMTLAQANRAGVNFNSGTEVAGFFTEKLISSVRAVA